MLGMSGGDHYLPLHRACEQGDVVKVGRLLRTQKVMTHVNEVDTLKQTPLLIAVKERCAAIVFQLLDVGGADLNIDIQDTFGKSALAYAAENNDRVSAMHLLGRQADPNSHDMFRVTPLIIACKRGYLSMVKTLLKSRRLQINYTDLEGATALWHAAAQGYPDIVRALLDRGANPRMSNVRKKSPLIAATENGHLGCVNLLLDVMRQNVDARDDSGMCALQYACEKNFTEIAETLVFKGGAYTKVRSDVDQTTLLMVACCHGNVRIATLLLEKTDDSVLCNVNAMDSAYRTALYYASNYPDIVALLLRHGAYPNLTHSGGKTPMMHAAELGCLPVMQQLLACKVDLETMDMEGYTAFMYACMFGKSDAALALLDAGASALVADFDDQTPLMLACDHQQQDVVAALLSRGVDLGINYRDERGLTALAKAAMRGNAPIVGMLLQHEALASIADQHGVTPLMWACRDGHAEAAALLLQFSPGTIDHVDSRHQSALYYASREDATDCVKLLLAHDADASVANANGVTPLMLACSGQNVDMASAVVHVLDGKGLNMHDSEEQTALHYACEANHTDMVALLLEKGADPTKACHRSITPLMLASAHGNERMMDALLTGIGQYYVDSVDWQHQTALYYATVRGHAGAVKKLLASHANVTIATETGATPLWVAVDQDEADIAHDILASLAGDPTRKIEYVNFPNDDMGRTPLHQAASLGYTDLVEFLLEHGAHPCAIDVRGNTPLLLACRADKPMTIRTLLRHASVANVNHCNFFGRSALYHAIAKKDMDLLEILHAQGARIQPLFDNGSIWSAGYPHYMHLNMLRRLVDGFGADVNARNSKGKTALHIVIMNFSHLHASRLVTFLLSRGANPWLKTPQGALPIACCRTAKMQDTLLNAMYEHERFQILEKARMLFAMHQDLERSASEVRTRESKRAKCISTAPQILKERLEAAEKLPSVRLKPYPSKLHGVLSHILEHKMNSDVFRELFDMMKTPWDS